MLLKIPGTDSPEGEMLLYIRSKGALPGAAAQSNLEGTTAEQVEMFWFKLCYQPAIHPTHTPDNMIHY